MNNTVTAHDLSFEIYISKEAIAQKVAEIGTQITKDYQNKNPLFIGILNGCFVFAADLMRACDMDCEVSFIKIASYEGTTSTGKITTLIGLNADEVKGRDIIIMEDIIDTGKTLFKFLKDLKAMKPTSIAIASLLLKPDAIQHPIPIDYLGFEIPNKFVIGYGLDYNGLGRNLEAIYQLKE